MDFLVHISITLPTAMPHDESQALFIAESERTVALAEAGSHDDVFLTDLTSGWAEVVNPALECGFRLDWDPAVFGWVISWQPYGGARTMPLRGCYGLGIEPWTSDGNLETAVSRGDAAALPPHDVLETTVIATITTR